MRMMGASQKDTEANLKLPLPSTKSGTKWTVK